MKRRRARKVYLTSAGMVVEGKDGFRLLPAECQLDGLFSASHPSGWLEAALAGARRVAAPEALRAPIQSQEVWAAGVTYYRSRRARIAESRDAGGGDFYDRVYAAERPELFFKASPHRVAAPGEAVRIRADSRWNVPEPELTLAIDAKGRIFGYTIGNDMSSRDIEAENPLYLPQAKIYDRSAALGPCLLVTGAPPPAATEIFLEVRRRGRAAFRGRIAVSRIKRPFAQLARYLFRANAFPKGCYLMTGTGIVPPDDFTLRAGDRVSITLPPVGTLMNPVAVSK